MLIKNGLLIPKKTTEDEKIIFKKPKEFNAEDFRMMERMQRPKSSCISVLVVMSVLASLSEI